jgi:di/tricarboxylate transporter
MPMGFCAILGGTLTMVGSSPLIMLNDLVDNANRSLPPAVAMEHFGLFAATPVGLALVVAGIGYFLLAGRYVLPKDKARPAARRSGTQRYLRRVHGIDAAIRELEVPAGSPLVGRDVRSIQREFDAKIVAALFHGRSVVSPSMETALVAPATIAVIAEPGDLRRFIAAGNLVLRSKLKDFRYLLARAIAGIAEIVVPPDSSVVGKTVRQLQLREAHGLSLLSIFRAGEAVTSGLQSVPFQAGDTLICHTRWSDLARLEQNRDFVIVTVGYPRTPRSPYKAMLALAFLALSLGLVLFTPIILPVALLTGAIGMVVAGVLTMDQAYAAVSWRSVFLLAGLLPLGHAVETSGAANYVALHVVAVAGGAAPIAIQAVLAVLSTAFTLIVSNVGATVLLVPIAINLAVATGADPAMFAMTVAISTSNSFLIPTHQVNALILGPGGYRVSDFLRAGSILTGIYIVVSLAALNLVF